ncbi:hypothetical protein SPI_01733 [Niveomyces insectorum RCEF 264]|uniref:Chromosome segregation ATPase family protein n=1 Tax=Niveomyces insectorum RCEF 264 TaxID=1081102 RepID=A0A167Z6I7_9HYPO|nr:hypothetical protein SPI_01733 [Niveomyces insectorum RCEF 264]
MPPIERDVAPWDGDRVLRHQHSSSSDHGRSLIPMWDSSDPERAPPPLPLNPQSPSVGTSRAGTSTAIQSAHAALTEKARENNFVSNVLTKRLGEASPERTPRSGSVSSSSVTSSARAPSHRRMQSLQPNLVRDMSLMLETGVGRESNNSTPRSPEKANRPSTPLKVNRESFISAEQARNDDKAVFATPGGPGPSLTPIVRPIVRRPHQGILGENTPPQSATMLALHSMAASGSSHREPAPSPAPQPAPPSQTQATQSEPAPPFSSITNSTAGSAGNATNNSSSNTTTPNNNMAMTMMRTPHLSVDNLSKQILGLTNIASSLQKEMSLLSRRSRDNATDLLSLKEATNARDEDIRRSLRELITNAHEATSLRQRDPYTGGPYLIEGKAHGHATSPTSKSIRPFSLPRIPSPTSFAASLDRESMSTPSLYAADGPNTIAMLEKIIKDMGTKEGQEKLLSRLSDVIDRLAGMASAAKLEQLLEVIKERQDRSVVPTSASYGGNGTRGLMSTDSGRQRTFSFDEPSSSATEVDYSHKGPMTQRAERLLQNTLADQRRSSAPTNAAVDVINDDILKIIRTVKDSVAQGGGLTAEVKALVRELRGEVLGMGREIGRRLDEAEVRAKDEGKPKSATQAEMAKIVEDGLAEMKQHMNNLMREHRRQSAASVAAVAAAAAEAVPAVDYQEVYNSMRAALKDSHANQPHPPEISREDVIQAVKDAWETYKPEIEVQQIGLERDEVLACLEEGLREYAPRDERPTGATRDEVFKAVVEGLRHFVPPQMPASSMSREEVLGAVRECLEEFEFPVAPSAMGAEITKEDMVDAVKKGLGDFDFPRTDRDLVLSSGPNATNEEIADRLQEIMQFLRDEFKAVSDEAKQNVAANGRDTEQVLDATRDGLEKLRADLEAYVDKVAAAVSHQDFSEGLIRTLDVFRDEIADLVSKASSNSKEMLKEEIETLRDTVNSSLVPALPTPAPAPTTANNKDVLEALQEGVNLLRGEISNRHVTSTSEVLDAIQEGLTDLRICIDKLGNKPADLTANDEILDALKSGLSDVRSEIDGLRDQSHAVATVESNTAMVPADMLRHDDIKNLEYLITQLRTKVDVIDAAQAKPSTDREVSNNSEVSATGENSEQDAEWKQKLSEMESKLHAIHDAVAGIASKEPATDVPPPPRAATDAASREDVEAIETILRNTKARLDDLVDGEQFVRKDHIDAIEALILETKLSLGNLKTQMDGVSSREDVNMVESLVAQVVNGFDEMKERHAKQLEDPEKVTKADVEAVALACLQVKSAVERMAQADESTALPSKDDLLSLAVIVREVKNSLEMESAVSAKAFEERQAEIVGVSDRVSEVRSCLEALNETVKNRLEDGVLGIESVGKILDSLSDTIGRNSSDLHDLYEAMRSEFEESRAGVVGAKLETDDRFQQTTETLEAKIDDRMTELVSKLDDFQTAMDERTKSGEARDVEVEAAVVGTKAIADELKLLIDTLGSAVTDSMEKMEEASKTVFNRVDDMVGKAEEHHSDGKAEHQQTRDQVQQAVDAVQGIQGHMVEYQPKILDTVNDVLLVVKEHFEHSKSSTATIQEKIVEAKPPEQPLLPPVEQYDDTSVQEKLDRLVGQTDKAAVAITKLDKMDALVDHTLAVGEALTKLDKLVEHSESADKALVRLDKLEQLEKLDKLDYLVAQSDTTSQALGGLERLSKLDRLVELTDLAGRAFDTQHAKIDRLVDHTQTANEAFSRLEFLGKMDTKLDQLEKLEKLEKLDKLETELEKLGKLDVLEKELEKLDKLEKLEKLDKLEKELEKLGKLDVLEKELESLHKLEKLEKLDQLDELVDHSRATDKTLSQLHLLDNVHQQVVRTAAELSQFLAAQTQRIADDHEDREKTLQETIIALERRQAEKEQAEAGVALLREEERRLKESVLSLRVEQEGMLRNKTRLTADVSSLETALRIRREELHEMESRAEGLERRILEGVMDHSRVLLMAKASKGREAMNRKRVVPPKKDAAPVVGAGGDETSNTTTTPNGAIAKTSRPRAAFNLAMAAKRNPLPANSPGGAGSANSNAGSSRRILSLSQINNSMSSGTIKRSQSVRANVGGAQRRKSSWGGSRLAAKGAGGLDADKENAPLKESDEEDRDHDENGNTNLGDDDGDGEGGSDDGPEDYHTPKQDELNALVPYERAVRDKENDAFQDCKDDDDDDDDDDKHSKAGTLRRSSLGTSIVTGETGSEAGESYSEDEDDMDVMSQWTSSQVTTYSAAPRPPAEGGAEMVLFGSEL